jgi:hypothetical protein
MNMTEITLVGIISSAAMASTMIRAGDQIDKINAQQAQVKCVQQSTDNLNKNLSATGNGLYEYAREFNQKESIAQKCNIEQTVANE